jgi:nucleoid-associated protein YgaU
MNPKPTQDLKAKYGDLSKAATDLGISNLQIADQGGKLQITGTAPFQLAKDELWNAIKSHAGYESEISADIKVQNTDIHGHYTVKSGDSLSKISKHIYGDAGSYTKIFEANRDILQNPDLIKPGQVLKIPR